VAVAGRAERSHHSDAGADGDSEDNAREISSEHDSSFARDAKSGN
jgi:hypothetical protein